MEEITELTIQINVGDFFSSWEEAEMQLNQYAKTTEFTICRKHTEVDDDRIVCQRTFECSHSGEAISNKVIDLTHQHQRPSRKIGYPWHINISNHKLSSGVCITSIVDQHNHPMVSDVVLYAPKYRKLSNEIMDKIEFYVTKREDGIKTNLSFISFKFS